VATRVQPRLAAVVVAASAKGQSSGTGLPPGPAVSNSESVVKAVDQPAKAGSLKRRRSESGLSVPQQKNTSANDSSPPVLASAPCPPLANPGYMPQSLHPLVCPTRVTGYRILLVTNHLRSSGCPLEGLLRRHLRTLRSRVVLAHCTLSLGNSRPPVCQAKPRRAGALRQAYSSGLPLPKSAPPVSAPTMHISRTTSTAQNLVERHQRSEST